MHPGWHPLVGCLVLVLIRQAAGDTIAITAGSSVIQTTPGVASLHPMGVSIRLTQYDLPASTLYYLPAGRPRSKKAVNQSRPLANGCVPRRNDGGPIAGYTSRIWPQEDAVHRVRCACRYPAGWKLLFYPAAISQSNKRWLVYDSKNHFQSYDTAEGEDGEVDFYDYEEAGPAGCERGLAAQFVLGAFPSNTAWGDIPVNKAAFWVSPAAAAAYGTNGSGGFQTAMSSQPYLCQAVPARVSGSDGRMYGIFPVASIALAAVIIFMALLSMLLLCCSSCRRKRDNRTQQKGEPPCTASLPTQR